jgi:hypothetical protein
MLKLLVIVFPLFLNSVATTSSFAPLLESVRSSTTKPLPLRKAVQNRFTFLIWYAAWLIPIPPLSPSHVGSGQKNTWGQDETSGCSALMVHSYDLP